MEDFFLLVFPSISQVSLNEPKTYRHVGTVAKGSSSLIEAPAARNPSSHWLLGRCVSDEKKMGSSSVRQNWQS